MDDEPLIRMSLRDVLEEQGFAVEEAENAEQALAILEASPGLEAMVTDVKMPGSSGLVLASQAADIQPQLRIVIMSGHANATDPNLPAVATFMRKPFPLTPFAEWLWTEGLGRHPDPKPRASGSEQGQMKLETYLRGA